MKPTRERILLAIFVLTFPIVAYISTLPAGRFRNEITEWGNRKSVAYQQYSDFRNQFGANEYVIVSWPGCTLTDPRVEQVTAAVESELSQSVQLVSSGLRMVQELTDRAKLSEPTAIKRLQGVIIGSDGSRTAVGFNLTEHGRQNRSAVMQRLDTILKRSEVDPDEAYFAGLGHNLHTMDKEGLESPFRMVPQIMLLALLLTLFFVRNFWLAFFINALGTYTGCLAFNFVEMFGVDMNAIIWPLPTLSMLLTVSASLHFLSYFDQATENAQASGTTPNDPAANDLEQVRFNLEQRRQVGSSARRSAIFPVACCTLTTAVGLLSLLLSSSEPVRQFGFFGSISILAANALMLIWLPPFLTMLGHADRVKSKQIANAELANGHAPTERWVAWERFTGRFAWPIIVGSLLVLALLSTGVGKIRTGSSLQNFFPARHSVLQDVDAIEMATGPLNSVELLIQFDNPQEASDRLRIRAMAALSARIVAQSPVKSCISAATFVPQWKKRPNAIQKAAERTRLKVLKDNLVESGLLRVDKANNQETWRISCRYSTLQKIELAELNETLRTLTHEIFSDEQGPILDGEQLDVVTTGEFVLFDFVDQQFFRELLITYATAFLLVTLVVLIVLRSPLSMLIALLPNLFPAVVVLGAVGHLGYRLDVASLMTASVALGIAVDDTLHFMLWQKKANQQPGVATNGVSAIQQALSHCGTAALQTSVILGTSIVLYAFCGFLPTVRFGILLSTMLFAALIGDLLLLPALAAKFGSKAADRTNLDGSGLSD